MNQNDLKNENMEGRDTDTHNDLVREICRIEARNYVLRKKLIINTEMRNYILRKKLIISNSTFMSEKDLQHEKEIVLEENKRLENEYRRMRVAINSEYGMATGGNN